VSSKPPTTGVFPRRPSTGEDNGERRTDSTEVEVSGVSEGGGNPEGTGGARDEGLTPEEKRMLASLGVTKAAEEPPLEDVPVAPFEDAPVFEEPPEAPQASEPSPDGPPAETSLSPEELKLVDRLRDESERLSREELPLMFEAEAGAGGTRRGPRTAVGAAAFEREVGVAPGGRVSPPHGGPAAFIDRALDVIDRPFRWVSPVWRMGLGLCGVLLLVTLLLVLLVRIVFGE